MDGINVSTGKRLAGIAHLRQSIRDILTTPKGARVMRRDYGSDLPRLVDAPMNAQTFMKIYAATHEAIKRWEPRFLLEQTRIVTAAPGRIELDLIGMYMPNGEPVTLDGIEIK